jgi:Rieske Fe-S protein
MDRKQFIQTCGAACLGLVSASTLFSGCASTKIIQAPINGSDLLLSLHHFVISDEKETTYKKYVMVHNEQLQYPVCVYRHAADQYTALFMRCTHQGSELQVFGDRLQCPAHGSEFDNKGLVMNGPAAQNLRTLPVQLEEQQLKISLK